MKKMFFIVFILATFVACDFVEFDPSAQIPTGGKGESQLMLKAGTISGGKVYVQKDVNTSIVLTSTNTANPLTSANWVIEQKNYNGLTISHKFASISTVTVSVSATFQDGKTEARDFTLYVIQDMSLYDPIRFFSKPSSTSGKYTVTLLFSKERFQNKTMYGYSGNFNDDNPSVWLAGVKILVGETNYVIENNLPKAVTGDVGKYVAITRDLLPREYSLAVGEFEKADGSGLFMWTDWSGSVFVKATENVGIIKFRLSSNGTITPLGDGYVPPVETMPGITGDSGEGVFRHELTGGKLICYFKLSDDFSKLTPFVVVKNQDTGAWGNPIALTAVANFPKYGKVELTEVSVLNLLTSVRFGNTLSTKTIDYTQMAKSSYYRVPFNEISFTIVKG